jgi:hypothetical protein
MARTVITLKGDPIVSEEFKALEAIVPGHLLLLNATGLLKNTASGANVAPAFALERDELGKEVGTVGSAYAYASGDYVKMGTFAPGMRVYAWLASGQNTARGDYLTGDGTGLLTKTNVSTSIRTARAVEAVDTSGSAPTTGTRIRVEIV